MFLIATCHFNQVYAEVNLVHCISIKEVIIKCDSGCVLEWRPIVFSGCYSPKTVDDITAFMIYNEQGSIPGGEGEGEGEGKGVGEREGEGEKRLA